jgi:signal transduction histidine kinase
MAMKISIRKSLTLWYCIVFCLSVCLLEAGVYVGLSAAMTSIVDKELGVRINGLDDFLKEHLGRLPLTRVLADLQIHVALQPSLTILQTEEGHTIYCGTQVQALCSAPAYSGNLIMPDGRHLRLHTARSTIAGQRYILLVATDTNFQAELLARFRALALLIIPAALICAALGGYWLSGRAFSPVREIIAAVQSINERSLSLRLKVPSTGDEIQLLSETLNGMLARVETSFRQITELTANASHELRTPTAIIRTASEVALLNSRPTLESHRNALIQICAEAEKNTRLLDSLLMLARSDAGVQPLNLSPVSLNESVGKALDACQYLADAKAIRLTLQTQPDADHVWADGTYLHRLWFLLIDNAIKYTPAGGSVSVSLKTTSTGHPMCEIKDSGIGIPESDLSLIFNRFYRAENTKAQSDVGSGLGLAMVKWITEGHRATVEVESAVNTGSTFRVIFPDVDLRPSRLVNHISTLLISIREN